jgi:hypothetical protein
MEKREILDSGREMLEIYKVLDNCGARLAALANGVDIYYTQFPRDKPDDGSDGTELAEEILDYCTSQYKTVASRLLDQAIPFQQWLKDQPSYIKTLSGLRRKNVSLVTTPYNVMCGEGTDIEIDALPITTDHCHFPPPMNMENLLEIRLQLIFSSVLGVVDTLSEKSFLSPSDKLVRAARKLRHELNSAGIDSFAYSEAYFLLDEIVGGRLIFGNKNANLQQVKRMAFKFALLDFSIFFVAKDKNGKKCRPYPEILIGIVGVAGIEIDERTAHRWIVGNAKL